MKTIDEYSDYEKSKMTKEERLKIINLSFVIYLLRSSKK